MSIQLFLAFHVVPLIVFGVAIIGSGLALWGLGHRIATTDSTQQKYLCWISCIIIVQFYFFVLGTIIKDRGWLKRKNKIPVDGLTEAAEEERQRWSNNEGDGFSGKKSIPNPKLWFHH